MQPGTFELLILVFIFLGLQAWWIIPIVIKNNKLNNRGKDLREEIKQLEKLERVQPIEKHTKSISINIPQPGRGPLKVADLVNITKFYDDNCVYKNFEFD